MKLHIQRTRKWIKVTMYMYREWVDLSLFFSLVTFLPNKMHLNRFCTENYTAISVIIEGQVMASDCFFYFLLFLSLSLSLCPPNCFLFYLWISIQCKVSSHGEKKRDSAKKSEQSMATVMKIEWSKASTYISFLTCSGLWCVISCCEGLSARVVTDQSK